MGMRRIRWGVVEGGWGVLRVWWAVGFSGHGRSSQSGGAMGMSSSGRCGWGKWGRRARVGEGFFLFLYTLLWYWYF